MRPKPLRWYVVVMRCIGGPLHEYKVEAEDAFQAHQQIQELFPGKTVVRIALAPPEFDGEDW
jgi:hypothetical protein